MDTQELIDYSLPCMAAQKALKNLHNAMLTKNYAKAKEAATEALVEVRMTLNAIVHEEEVNK